jgi:outer membrane protein OmpA-like peptidoglycan-associated protein
VNIAPGTERAPAVAEGGTIPGREPFVFGDLLQQTSDAVAAINDAVERVSDDVERTVEQVALTAEGARILVEDVSPRIRSIAEDGARISEDARRMVAGVESGEGTIGKLIRDDSLYQSLRQVAEQSSAVMGNVRQATDETRRVIADFRSQDGPAGGLYSDMRMTLSQAREATADLADNMEALKRNFFLRGFFNKRGYFDLDNIAPAEYRAGVLERDRRRAARIWLSSRVVFERGPDGREVLTPAGRGRIDSAMAAFLEYLPASPLVIEGYAASSAPGDRFATSRHRAGIVRDYLLARYQLMPQHTGFIALGAEADGSPDGDRWDGIAVTLFLDSAAVRLRAQAQQAGAKPAPPSRPSK